MARHPETDQNRSQERFGDLWDQVIQYVGNTPTASMISAEITEAIWTLHRKLDRHVDDHAAAEIMKLASARYDLGSR